ncbi:GD22977 [Drosophila simulans]|uniref:GD22977 n=1 Tax=Drosophila simulans TaxID=7240 RepID=B4Q5P1_DROSI|nr:GD22977 [Drosophila simulans]
MDGNAQNMFHGNHQGWGRWSELLELGQFKRGWRDVDVEDCARIILLYCLQVYKGDEKIKTFIWDLITPTEDGEVQKISRDHSGLHNLVPRETKTMQIRSTMMATRWTMTALQRPKTLTLPNSPGAITRTRFSTRSVLVRLLQALVSSTPPLSVPTTPTLQSMQMQLQSGSGSGGSGIGSSAQHDASGRSLQALMQSQGASTSAAAAAAASGAGGSCSGSGQVGMGGAGVMPAMPTAADISLMLSILNTTDVNQLANWTSINWPCTWSA